MCVHPCVHLFMLWFELACVCVCKPSGICWRTQHVGEQEWNGFRVSCLRVCLYVLVCVCSSVFVLRVWMYYHIAASRKTLAPFESVCVFVFVCTMNGNIACLHNNT